MFWKKALKIKELEKENFELKTMLLKNICDTKRLQFQLRSLKKAMREGGDK